MISHRQQRRLDWVFTLSLIALLVNIVSPAEAKSLRPKNVGAQISETEKQENPTLSLPIIPDKPIVAKKTLVVRSSAYSSTKDQTDNDPFTTASGTKVRDGIIAMNGIPFGTKVRIPKYFGDKVFTVEDRMHRRWGTKKIDIWMPSRAEAKQWGVRTVTIEIL